MTILRLVILLNLFCFFRVEGAPQLWEYSGRFSTFNEENIVQDLWTGIADINRFYVDIGASDGLHGSNTARLALNGWSGLALEGSREHALNFLQTYKTMENVKMVETIVTPLNVCNLLKVFNVPQNFGVLSLDIDSYDYFVLEALLEKFRPVIIITEINEKIPPPLEFTVLYEESHHWDYSHFFGQSISQLEKLCLKNDYCIACLEYNNAILVAKEFFQGQPLTAQEAYLTGYQLREERKYLFSYNYNMEWLLEGTPEVNSLLLKNFFSKYDGKFTLTGF